MKKKLFYVKPTTTVICAEGGSLLAASGGISVGGEDFPWELGATGNDDPWQIPTRSDLAIGLEDAPEDDDAW